MDNFRRRLLSSSNKDFIFSAQTTVYIGSCGGSEDITIESTLNGINTPFEVVSYTGLITDVVTDSTNICIYYNENSSEEIASGTIILRQIESGEIITIEVIQESLSYTFETSYTSSSINGSTTSTYFYVSSEKNCNYLPFTVESYDGMITEVTIRNDQVFIKCDENTTTSSRSGTITLKQTETNETITYTLVQNAIVYTFTAKTTSINATDDAGSTQINITSTKDYSYQQYTVESYNGPITSVVISNKDITVNWSKNNSGNQRNGTIILKQTGSNKTIVITIEQSSKTVIREHQCIVLDSTSNSTGYTTLNVIDGTITSKPSWVTTTLSNGTLNVTALSSNDSSSSIRSGDIIISWTDQSITIAVIQLQSDYLSKEYVNIAGLNWGIKNVGASSPTDYGNYYQYGKGAATIQETYKQSEYSGREDPLASSVDTATQVLGSNWRTPTQSEYSSLNQQTHYFSHYNDINGFIFTNNTNAIFFPTAGYYDYRPYYLSSSILCSLWTSTQSSNGVYVEGMGYNAENDRISAITAFVQGTIRKNGYVVRGVYNG